MKRASNGVLFCLIGLLAGLAIGFVLANSYSRSYFSPVASQISNSSPPSNSTVSTANENDLSEEEIRRAFQNADARAADGALQLQIGMALYEYAKSRQDAAYLPELERILKRAEKHDADNVEVLMALGEIAFVRGQETKQSDFYFVAQSYFQKTLKLQPDKVNARVNLAATYLFAAEPQPALAIAHLEKSLALEPRNELVIIYLINALILENRLEDATRQIESLQITNPANPVLPDLRAQVAQKKQVKINGEK